MKLGLITILHLQVWLSHNACGSGVRSFAAPIQATPTLNNSIKNTLRGTEGVFRMQETLDINCGSFYAPSCDLCGAWRVCNGDCHWDAGLDSCILNNCNQACPTRHGYNVHTCACYGNICLGGGKLSEGNVFVCGRPICDDLWSNVDAQVLCRQIGFASGTATYKSEYGRVQDNYIMDDVECVGRETNIFNCEHEDEAECGATEAAGVICR